MLQIFALYIVYFLAAQSAAAQTQSAPEFDKDIRPVFEKACYSCHGPKMQLGGLRLDARNTALNGGVSGKSILPGDALRSSLFQRIAGTSDQARMPMGSKPLDPAVIDTIRRWIEAGAEWPESASSAKAEVRKHWAYVPPVRPLPPAVKLASWSGNPIDRFVLARLEKKGLSPSKAADRTTLLRRLSLDLIGLPPTIAEIDAFLMDRSPNAYEKQVNRLLASPHYGERWGRHWLDAARYADSDGFEKDKMRNVWFYRDWVINSLNRDLPYDQFVIQQIAGDLLPNPTQDQLVATGFLRNSMINEEGGIDPEQFRMEAMFDRMDAVGKAVLGVTIQCAQCHNHKFDPLTQEEYYRLFAFLNTSSEGSIAVYTPEEQRRRARIYQRMEDLEASLRHSAPDWKERMAIWESAVVANQIEWNARLPEVDDISTGGQKYLPLKDNSLLAAGYAPTKHRVKLTFAGPFSEVRAIRLDLLNDSNLPLAGPGRSIWGTAALTEFEVSLQPAGKDAKPEPLKIASATADFNPPEESLDPIFDDRSKRKRVTGPIGYAIDGQDETAWSIESDPGPRNQPRNAVFILEKPVSIPEGASLVIYLKQNHGGWNSDDNQSNNLGRFRLSFSSVENAAADTIPAGVRAILATPVSQRTERQNLAIFRHWRSTVPEWESVNQEIAALWKTHPKGSSQLILAAMPEARSTHILQRGDFLKPGMAVNPGVPAFLHKLPENSAPDRLSFAKWLVSRNSPTTARSMVNRIWQAYFGTGLVTSSEDLGKQSETPSHPELLDWLAVEFMDRGWSLKHIHKLIVTSAAYRQSSNVTPEMLARDPYNRLIARGPRLRVEAEIVRDIALAASGLLNVKVGGPSVFPPAPDFLFQPPVSYGPKNWHEEKGDDRHRRGLYTFRYRSVPYPVLQTFDAPNGDMACVRRARSNTPLQALTTLNEPLFLETARALALKTIKEGGATDSQRIDYAFRRCVSRFPTTQERAELLALLSRQAKRMAEQDRRPWDLIGANPSWKDALPRGMDASQVAAWTLISRVILNLDETITKE